MLNGTAPDPEPSTKFRAAKLTRETVKNQAVMREIPCDDVNSVGTASDNEMRIKTDRQQLRRAIQKLRLIIDGGIGKIPSVLRTVVQVADSRFANQGSSKRFQSPYSVSKT